MGENEKQLLIHSWRNCCMNQSHETLRWRWCNHQWSSGEEWCFVPLNESKYKNLHHRYMYLYIHSIFLMYIMFSSHCLAWISSLGWMHVGVMVSLLVGGPRLKGLPICRCLGVAGVWRGLGCALPGWSVLVLFAVLPWGGGLVVALGMVGPLVCSDLVSVRCLVYLWHLSPTAWVGVVGLGHPRLTCWYVKWKTHTHTDMCPHVH